MLKKLVVSSAAVIATAMLVAGCGTTGGAGGTGGSNATNNATPNASTATKTNTTQNRTEILGGGNYKGKLSQFVKTADANPHSEADQIQAGIAAYVNQNFQDAIKYYKRATVIAPKDVVPYNNLGNVYFRGLSDPTKALAFYQKATQLNAKYAFAWWNLAMCEAALGNKAAAKTAISTGLKNVPKSDANYKNLVSYSKQLG